MNYIYEEHLQSPRLITRKLTMDDIEPWTEFFADKQAIEYFPSGQFESDRARSQQWIEKQLDRYANNRFGLQALIDKEHNRFIGQCGLLEQQVDGKTEIETGYHIFKKYWGNGFAPEAARLFIDYAFKNNLAKSVISIIDKRNIRSQRVADKNGLIREKETNWMGLDVFIYRVTSEAWR